MAVQKYQISESQLNRDYTNVSIQRSRTMKHALDIFETLVDALRYDNAYDPFKMLRESYGLHLSTRTQARRYLEDLRDGRRRLFETQSSSDFPALTANLLGRQLRAKFMQAPSVWSMYTPRRPSPIVNFKNVNPLTVDRGDRSTTYGEAIPAGAGYGFSSFVDGNEPYKVNKFIEGYNFTFELSLDDDLGGLNQILQYMVEDQQRVLEDFVVGLHAGATGPLGTVYSAANGNIIVDGVTTNPLLSLSAIQSAVGQLEDAVDSSGVPITPVGPYVLVVGTGRQKILAQQLINTREVVLPEPDSAAGGQTRSAVTLPDIMVVNNPFIKDTVTTNLATSWWLFQAPTNANRNWAQMGFLDGFDIPRAFVKAPNAQGLDGVINQQIGSIDNFTTQWAVVMAFGGIAFASAAQTTVASNGTELP